MPALASVSFPGQSTVKAKNGMEIGHGDESIASKISKAHFSWILKAISYHVSKCNPLAINSHVRPSAALSYQTVKLRCLGTLVCLVLSNFRAPGKQRETRWLAYKQIVPLEVQTRQIEMIEHLRMKKTWEMFHLQFEQTDSFTTWPTTAAFPVTSRLSPLHVHMVSNLKPDIMNSLTTLIEPNASSSFRCGGCFAASSAAASCSNWLAQMAWLP